MPGTKASGNRTAKRGRKLRRTIHLSEDTARSLRVLTLNARGVRNRPDLTEDDLVEELIDRAWQLLDQSYQQAADGWQGEPL